MDPINSMALNDNIFFDFKEPEFCHSDKNSLSNCKYPLIKNNGKVIDIDHDCGVLIMPQHLNGYRCYKVSLNTPAEHKLSNLFINTKYTCIHMIIFYFNTLKIKIS